MSAGSILIGLLMVAATLPFVIKPLLKPQRLKPARASAAPVSNVDVHQAALLALRDLEFDHRTGKVTDEDYANLRADLLAQAAVTLAGQNKQGATSDRMIEQAVRDRRQTNKDALIESAVRSRRQTQGAEQTAKFCPKCGRKAQGDDRFCASCGTSLTLPAEVTA